MNRLKLAGTVLTWCLLTCAASAAPAPDDATLFRVFLKDGSSLVSYGEIARVEDRVIFSMPTAATPNPPLHLINIGADRVDWDRTDRYAASARAARYLATQAENDYTSLSNQVAATLNEVAFTTEAARRLDIVAQARKTLADWPRNHYNYRETEVRQMLGLLDEAIADLRASAGQGRFSVDLVAYAGPPVSIEPLLPAPTPQEAIQQTLTAARISQSPAERTSLFDAVLVSLDRDSEDLPADWAAKTRAETEAAIATELRTDKLYQTLTTRMLRAADVRARLADVRGVERVIAGIRQQDQELGGSRPDAVTALVAAVEEKLDAARRLRLARDRWALRAPELRKYGFAITEPLDLFGQLTPWLDDIKSLAGSSPVALSTIERLVRRIVRLASAIVPPDEFTTAHALLVSASQLAENAAHMRRAAILSNSIESAWDASSAAAGAMMLGARAKAEIHAALVLPQLK